MPVEVSAISQVADKTVSGLFGAGQIIGGLLGRHNNQKNLDNLANPTYSPNKVISDYYQTALNKYNAGPYNSAFYQTAQKQAQHNLATGINTLQDRRSALAGIPGLIEGTDLAMDKAGVEAEGQQRQQLGILGQATQMKAGDDRYAFDINNMLPFERKYSEYSGKLAANNQMINAGITNFAGGLTGGGGPNIGGLPGSTYTKPDATRSSVNTPIANTSGGLGQGRAAGTYYIDPRSFSNF